MTIAFDASYRVGGQLSGVGVYSRNITDALAQAHPESRFLFCYRPHRFLRGLRDQLPRNAHRRLLLGKPPSEADIFHALNQRVDIRHRRTVTTFHDLFVLTAEYSTPEFRRRFAEQARRAAQQSDLIIAVSRFTANQVHDLLDVEQSRIRVIPHGCSRATPTQENTREKMFLFVGSVQARKNVTRLIEAYEQCPPDWKLVLAGSFGYGAEEIQGRIERSPRRNSIEVLGYVSDSQLEALYAHASVLAFPSLDEGFGIPVLEAMAHGLPVLTSNTSALPEIAGDAAMLVNPHSTAEIASGLVMLASDEGLRLRLASAGLKRSVLFTWENAAAQTWAVYLELLERKSG